MFVNEIINEIENINEYKTDSVPVYGEEVRVYYNYTHSNLLKLLDKFPELRGTVKKSKIYLWNAMDAAHRDIDEGLQEIGIDEPNGRYSFYISKNKNIQSWTWGKDLIKLKDDLYVGVFDISKHDVLHSLDEISDPRLNRLLGLK